MPTGPTSLVHWLGGFDLAGVGALTEIADVTEAEFRGVTPLGPQGAIEHEAPLGRIKYTLTESGHLAGEPAVSCAVCSPGGQRGIRPSSGTSAAPWARRAVLASRMRIKKSSIPPDMNDFTKLALEYACERPCDIFDGTVLVHGGQRVTHDAPASPYDGLPVRRPDHEPARWRAVYPGRSRHRVARRRVAHGRDRPTPTPLLVPG